MKVLLAKLEETLTLIFPFCPFLVKIWITPFAPCAPYKEAEAAPCTTSTRSTCVKSIVVKLENGTSTPSNNTNGRVPPCTVLIPRKTMFTWSPGLPDTEEICAPGILPIKA